eukprot:5397141-Pleurochrysis_carterae.AAC.2
MQLCWPSANVCPLNDLLSDEFSKTKGEHALLADLSPLNSKYRMHVENGVFYAKAAAHENNGSLKSENSADILRFETEACSQWDKLLLPGWENAVWLRYVRGVFAILTRLSRCASQIGNSASHDILCRANAWLMLHGRTRRMACSCTPSPCVLTG